MNKGEDEKDQPKGDEGAEENKGDAKDSGGGGGGVGEMKKGDYMVHVYL
jgi:hypothetical protein